MKAAVARYYYRHIAHIAALIEAMNVANGGGDAMYSAGNEAISKIAQEMISHCEDITATDEFPPVDLGEAS
jgi:hypothetical protein